MAAVLGSVNIGRLLVADWAGSVGHTGIDKRPASGRVRLSTLGIDGDEISDRRHHGGFDQALYAHATDEEVDASNPSEVQRKLIEQAKQRNDAIKKLQEAGK